MKTFDEIKINDSGSLNKKITSELVERFAEFSGDHNPIHLDEDFAKKSRFGARIAHGALLNAFFSTTFATQHPGSGSIYVSQDIRYMKPVYLGDQLQFTVTVTDKNEAKKMLTYACEVKNQNDILVAKGQALLYLPE